MGPAGVVSRTAPSLGRCRRRRRREISGRVAGLPDGIALSVVQNQRIGRALFEFALGGNFGFTQNRAPGCGFLVEQSQAWPAASVHAQVNGALLRRRSPDNGVPSLSILDGWWIEGCIEGLAGWAIGDDSRASNAPAAISTHAGLLYEKLEKVVVPTFYQDRARFMNIMMHCIALNGSSFNTQRMILEYVSKAYLP